MITDKDTIHEINNIRQLLVSGIGFAVEHGKSFNNTVEDPNGKKKTVQKHIKDLVNKIDQRLEKLIKIKE
ncbi:MAG: hypothetical protein KQ78_02112 [Candidatus Izimaplasma bacterium HR2]|nr:MAG: hypothetical protein KQ78_02112 [Candidatus Izimaplasma bacterium HR2]